MSREVIADLPPDGDLSHPDDVIELDHLSPAEDLAAVDPWWRRRPSLGAATGVAAVALVLGLLTGTSQGRAGQQQQDLTGTRLVVMVDRLDVASGNLRISGTLRVMSPGGAVLLSRLATPYGDFPISPEVQLRAGAFTTVPIDGIADCTDPSTATATATVTATATTTAQPVTGSASVRDRQGAAPRDVPADLEAGLATYLRDVPCHTSAGQPTIGAGTNAATGLVLVESMASDGTGTLDFDLWVDGDLPKPIEVRVDVLELLRQPFDGNFTVKTTPAMPVTLTATGGPVHVQAQLTYRCQKGTQVIPWPEEVLGIQAQTSTGLPPGTGGFELSGWVPQVGGDVVRAAMLRAGCPYSEAQNPPSGTVVSLEPTPSSTS